MGVLGPERALRYLFGIAFSAIFDPFLARLGPRITDLGPIFDPQTDPIAPKPNPMDKHLADIVMPPVGLGWGGYPPRPPCAEGAMVVTGGVVT